MEETRIVGENVAQRCRDVVEESPYVKKSRRGGWLQVWMVAIAHQRVTSMPVWLRRAWTTFHMSFAAWGTLSARTIIPRHGDYE